MPTTPPKKPKAVSASKKKAAEKAAKTKSGKMIVKEAPKKPAAKKPAASKAKTAAPKAKIKVVDTNIHDIIMKTLDQDKGQDIISIDLKGKTAIADFMVIASGTSNRHISSMASRLRDRLSKEGWHARVEGLDNADWVVLDAGSVIVHLFKPEVREFYNLEKLWASDFSTVGYNLYTTK